MGRAEKHQLIYIEDDPDMIQLVKIVLDDELYEIRGALDGESGLRMIHEERPDLVLLDLMLPDLSGWAVYQAMKEDRVLKNIPVIVITAQNAPIDRVLGEHIAKVQVYITKPFSTTQLREAVRETLNNA
jgi:two-component system, OmpR family, response regulator VicR